MIVYHWLLYTVVSLDIALGYVTAADIRYKNGECGETAVLHANCPGY